MYTNHLFDQKSDVCLLKMRLEMKADVYFNLILSQFDNLPIPIHKLVSLGHFGGCNVSYFTRILSRNLIGKLDLRLDLRTSV